MEYFYKRMGHALRLRQLGLAALLACGAATARGQALNYPLANAQNLSGTYTDLGTTGTVITTANTDDANSAEQLIGFDFSYNGTTMDRLILNTNGFLKLCAGAGTSAPTVNLYTAYAEFNSGGTLLGTAANDVNLLSPFNYDLADGTSPAEFRLATTGTAPNRICTVQWKNVADKAQLSQAGGTSILTQYTNMSFQVRLYEANGTIEFVFAAPSPAPVANNNFKYAQMGIKGSGNGSNQILRVTKGSMSPWGDAAVTFAAGPVTAGATGAFNYRQAVPADNGRTYRFVPSLPNDAGVNQLYTINQLAVPGTAPHAVRAVVSNNGTSVLTNLSVTLNVTGANTFTNVQTVPSLAVGATAAITFSAYTPVNQGTNTVTVSVPNDDNNSNNSKAETQVVNPTTFSYISPGTGATSAVGYPSGSENGFAAKFSLASVSTVTAVRAFVFDAATIPPTQKTTVGETLYGVVVDPTSGAILGRSPNFVVTAADINAVHTFTLSSPVTVQAGDFLAGMIQVSPASNGAASFFPMGVQNEAPTRAGTFYRITTAAGGAPVDAVGGTSKYLLEAVTAAPATCPQPANLVATSSTATSVSFSFSAAANATGYQIVYGPQGFTPSGTSSTTAMFTGTTYTVPGLTAGTVYDFYIRTICSATDQSLLTGPVRASTACTSPTISAFPYVQNFDVVASGQTLPCGISVTDANNDGFTWQPRGSVANVPNSTNVARSAPNAMVYGYNSTDLTVGANDWFYTPALATAAAQRYRVSFYYRGPAASGSNTYTNALEVKYGTAASPAGQTSPLFTNNAITSAAYQLANNASTPVVLDLTPAAGTYYVGFHAISQGDQGFLAVDDLTITAGPLATSEALKRAVSLFPNPSATGVFTLEVYGANAKQALGVEVTNLLGQRVYTGTAKDNFRTSVDLSALANGLYSLKVRNGEEYTMQQISIVK